jgi:hypothetical protein
MKYERYSVRPKDGWDVYMTIRDKRTDQYYYYYGSGSLWRDSEGRGISDRMCNILHNFWNDYEKEKLEKKNCYKGDKNV